MFFRCITPDMATILRSDFIDFKTIAENKDFALDDLLPKLFQKYPLGEKLVFQLKKSLVYFDDAEKDLNISIYHEGSGTSAALDQQTWLATKKFFIEYVAKGQLLGQERRGESEMT